MFDKIAYKLGISDGFSRFKDEARSFKASQKRFYATKTTGFGSTLKATIAKAIRTVGVIIPGFVYAAIAGPGIGLGFAGKGIINSSKHDSLAAKILKPFAYITGGALLATGIAVTALATLAFAGIIGPSWGLSKMLMPKAS